MRTEPVFHPHRATLLVVAAIVPLVLCAGLAAFRDSVAAAPVALVLVLVVVAVAATGVRVAGFIAALSSGLWFDFFLTAPYQSFKITDRADIETAVLLLVVGAAVTEIALWGRRQQARASRRAGYLDGVFGTADIVTVQHRSPSSLTEHVSRQIVEILDIDACRFEADGASGRPSASLDHDGSVTQLGRPVDVDRHGLPTDDLIALDVQQGGASYGRFLLTSSTRMVRPSLEQRRVVVLLAEQVGAALASVVD
jgi:K+-sensing histidine kinase KdpD